MKKAEFMQTLQEEHRRWEARLAQFPDDVALPMGWRLKDLLAHVTWYEREMLNVIRSRKLVGSPHWDLPLDRRNAVIYEENQARPWPEVIAESRQVYQQLLEALETLTDEDLADAGHFAEMPEAWKPWEMIASNTYEHYQQHFPDLKPA